MNMYAKCCFCIHVESECGFTLRASLSVLSYGARFERHIRNRFFAHYPGFCATPGSRVGALVVSPVTAGESDMSNGLNGNFSSHAIQGASISRIRENTRN